MADPRIPLAAPITAVTGLRVPVAENIRIPDLSGGINIDLRQRNPNGLVTYVQAYVGMAVGDQIDLRWGPALQPIGTFPVTVLDQPVIIVIPWERVTEGIELADYDVHYVDGRVETSPGRMFQVKFTRPGGNDPQAGVPGHQGLIAPILPQHIIDDGVGEDEAAAGVPLRIRPYLNMSEGDRIEVRWGTSELFKWPALRADEVGSDVIVTVPEETILLGGDGPRVPVCYRVIDQVGNFSLDSDQLHWSPNTWVDVYAGNSKLAAPQVLEAVDGVLDLDVLQMADVTVRVIADANPPFAVGDSLVMTWRGTTVAEESLEFQARQVLQRVPMAVDFIVPYAQVSALYSRRAIASYTLEKQDGQRLGSKRTAVQIKGNPLWLAPPVILDAVGNVLPADLPAARVQVPAYSEMREGDELSVEWRGVAPFGQTVEFDYVRQVTHEELWQPIVRLFGHEFIAPLDGGRLRIRYTVSNATGRRESDWVPYNVGEDVGLPAPRVAQAQDDVLDPYLLPPQGATLVVPLVSLVELGDTLTFAWRGSVSGLFEGSAPITTLIGPLYFDVERDRYVAANLLGTVQASYRINRNGSLVGTSPVLNLRILSVLQAPSVKQANGEVLDPALVSDILTVVIPTHPAFQPSDQLTVRWAGYPGAPQEGSYTSLPRPVSHGLEVDIPSGVLRYNLGQHVTVSYTLTRTGGGSIDSEVLRLSVQPLAAGALNQLIIEEADNQGAGPRFDVAQLTRATARVGTWPLITVGQPVWLYVRGTNADGSPYLNQPWAGDTHTTTAAWVAQGFATTAIEPVPALRYLRDGSDLTLTFKAALNGVVDESQAVTFTPRTYRVAAPADTRPQITRADDSRGQVANGGTTTDAAVTLTGTATALQQVEIKEGALSKGIVSVDASGSWRLSVTGLVPGNHAYTASGLYGSGLPSPPWNIAVAVALTPVISRVDDRWGAVEVDGITTDDNVLLTGTATANLRVEVFDDGTSKGIASVNANGDWSHRASNLALGAHRLEARGLYGATPPSNRWPLTVALDVKPAIETVRDSRGDVTEGGTSFDDRVDLTGTATANLSVEIFDGTLSKGIANVSSNGTWAHTVAALGLGPHRLVAQARYGASQESAPRTFTVAANQRPAISDVRDARGTVRDGGTTTDAAVTLTGSASPNQKVRVFDQSTLLATVDVDGSGAWSHRAISLGLGAHRFTAQAAYGTEPVSKPWTITVAQALEPAITDLRDSRGTIAPAGSTTDVNLTVSGTATANLTVELFDGAASLGVATVSSGGTWSLALTALSLGSHSLTAKALYDAGQTSPPRTFTIAEALRPRIVDVTDSRGSVADGGTTFDSTLTLIGTATANLQVDVYDDATFKATVDVNASGEWRYQASGLTNATHPFTAVARYGTGWVSNAWRVTVAVSEVPQITAVFDSRGTVGNGGSTFDNSVQVSGRAAANERVTLLDGGVDKGTATVSAAGTWTHTVSGLNTGGHALTARAQYGSQPPSTPWNLTVVALQAPSISAVRDPGGTMIPIGGTTVATNVTVSGSASVDQRVEVFDNASLVGTVTATGGQWSINTATLPRGDHTFLARGMYADNPVSNSWRITVGAALDFGGNHTMNAGQQRVVEGHPPSNPIAAAVYTRAATGGVPGYTYSSSNTNVAQVNNVGRVVAAGNGTATISVRDSVGQTKSYQLTVTGLIVYVYVTTDTAYAAYLAVINRGLRMPSIADLQYLYSAYRADQPMDRYVGWPENGRGTTWTPENANAQGSWKWAVHVNTGGTDYYWTVNISLLAVGIRP